MGGGGETVCLLVFCYLVAVSGYGLHWSEVEPPQLRVPISHHSNEKLIFLFKEIFHLT